MTKPAIVVENVSKVYRIGNRERRADTLVGAVTGALAAPVRNFRNLYRLGTAGRDGDATDTIRAVDDVSFEVQQGEALGVIGRNGAGKSTLLKILSRVTRPTYGRIRMRGRVSSLLEVGTGFHPELTGRENVYLNGTILGMTKREIDRKFDEIVAFSGVEKFLDTPVKRYSSGMKVRLAFAVAAHLEPEILIIDEVLAVGDAEFQKKCLGKMRDVAGYGRTVMFVSHNMAAVSQLCDRAVWLERGQVEKDGDSDDVIKAYLIREQLRAAERRWADPATAPGDDRVRLLSCRVVQGDEIAPVVDINRPSRVELEFQVLREARNLITGVSYYDALGTCLFATCDWRPNQLVPDRYFKQVEVPAQLLAEGRINVLAQLVFFDPDVRSVVEPDVISFDAVDSDHPLSVRGHYKGAWPGLLRIGLPWSVAIPAPSLT